MSRHAAEPRRATRRADDGPGLRGQADAPASKPRPPIVLADFEGDDYGDWTGRRRGVRQGPGPRHAGRPADRSAAFQGKGLVNTFLRAATRPQGKLTSPAFTIERPFISFLIGGGNHAGKTCINLLVDGKVVRTATGKNNEKLAWHNWNVRDLARQAGADRDRRRAIRPLGPHQRRPDRAARQAAVRALRAAGAAGRLRHDGPGAAGGEVGRSDRHRPADRRRRPRLPAAAARCRAACGRRCRPAGGRQAASAETARRRAVRTVSLSRRAGGHGDVRRRLAFPQPARARQLLRHAVHGRRGGGRSTWRRTSSAWPAQTRLWHDTWYDSTLPYWLLDRLFSTVSILATGTCQWWANGRFWAWEGVGCCHGTCAPRLELRARHGPAASRTGALRPRDAGLRPEAGFDRGDRRGPLPRRGLEDVGRRRPGGHRAKAYREHQMSADGEFLKRNWPRIRKSLEFLIQRGRQRRRPDRRLAAQHLRHQLLRPQHDGRLALPGGAAGRRGDGPRNGRRGVRRDAAARSSRAAAS